MNEQQQGIDLAALLIRTAAEYGGDLNGALYDLHLGRKAREAGMVEVVIAAAGQAQQVADLPDAVIQATAEALGDAYDCMRVWSAWGVGTMGPDDFLPVADDGDRVADIARAAITAWRSSATMTTAQQQNDRECGCGWSGAVGDCVWLGSVGPLCPNCHETTEEAAQPPAVAVPEWLTFDRLVNSLAIFVYGATQNPLRDQLTPDHWKNALNDMASQSGMFNAMAAVRAMLAAAQKGGEA